VLVDVLVLEFRDASAVTLRPGMALTVPARASHRFSSVRVLSVSLKVENQQVVLEEQ